MTHSIFCLQEEEALHHEAHLQDHRDPQDLHVPYLDFNHVLDHLDLRQDLDHLDQLLDQELLFCSKHQL